MRLHNACWREAYAPYVDAALLARAAGRHATAGVTAWTKQLVDGPPRVLAEADGELRGLRGRRRRTATGRRRAPTELYAIYTRAAWWGTGLGQRLWDAVAPTGRAPCGCSRTTSGRVGSTPATASSPTAAASCYDDLGTWEIRMIRR